MFKILNIFIVLCVNLCLVLAEHDHIEFKDVTDIPNDVPRCRESDPNLSECMRKAFQEMIKMATNGVPELNIPPIDPLVVQKANYQFTNNIVQGKVALRNLQIKGLSKFVYNSIDYKKEGDTFTMDVEGKAPKLFIEGKYKAEIQINNAKVNSKGDFNVTMSDIDAPAHWEGEWYKRDGKNYIRITKFNIDPTLGNMRFYATGIMPDPTLNEAILEYVNQNWRNLYKSLITATKNTWEPELVKFSNEYFSHLPFDTLLIKD